MSTKHPEESKFLEEQEKENVNDLNTNDNDENEARGVCKWFNVAKGYGFVSIEDKQKNKNLDVFVYQSTIQMPGFRTLKEGEKVRVWFKKSKLGLEATKVCNPSGGDCVGIDKRPRKNREENRCFNCGDIGHHAKECQFPPLPKRCHLCKSYDHLQDNCPEK